jgi:hypothetical protein
MTLKKLFLNSLHSCFVYTAVGFVVVARPSTPRWLALKGSPKEQGYRPKQVARQSI